MAKTPLPIDSHLDSILKKIGDHSTLILEASPGVGKTTRVPPALLDAKWCSQQQAIWVLEPRRIAAKLSAERVAFENGWSLGGKVGYHFRLENRSGDSTRLLFLTEGMLLRRMLGNPTLKGVACVVLDEFHERSIYTDSALALLERLRKTARPDLKIVIMSATLDVPAIAKLVEGAAVYHVVQKMFEVETVYLPHENRDWNLSQKTSWAVDQLAARDIDGDILCFLPGMREIRQAAQVGRLQGAFEICILHSQADASEQKRALERSSRQKIILSTNIAETSVTIAGVRAVIDFGLARQSSVSDWGGFTRLTTQMISQASAIQRAGRAGREASGVCVRLYSKSVFEGRPRYEVPQIFREDLSSIVLGLLALVKNMGGVKMLSWIEPPKPGSMELVERLLLCLGAIDPEGSLTPMGQALAKFPTNPRLAALVLKGDEFGVGREAVALAAGIARGTFLEPDLMTACKSWDRASELGREREELNRTLESVENLKREKNENTMSRGLAKAVLFAFSDRVAVKNRNETDLVMALGGRVEAPEVLSAPYLGDRERYYVIPECSEAKKSGSLTTFRRADCFVEIEADWLLDDTIAQGGLLTEQVEEIWNETGTAAKKRSVLKYGQIVLSTSETNIEGAKRALKESMVPAEILNPLKVRWGLLREKLGAGSKFPELDQKRIENALELVTDHRFDLLEEFLLLQLEDSTLAKMFRQAVPSELQLASGRRVKIQYEPGKPPWVQSRIQDFFGLAETPAICGGKILLTLHLTAPNQRPVQITSDLKGFWEREYPKLRIELGRRYPRHKWPEKPF